MRTSPVNSEPNSSESPAPLVDQRLAARFLLRVLVYCAPFLVAAVAFEVLCYRTGENWPIASVMRAQETLGAESLYGTRIFSSQWNLYNLETIRKRRPKILALGSSHVGTFRGAMFHPFEQDFYNACWATRGVEDFREYTERVRRGDLAAPEVLVVMTDWNWFARELPESQTWLDEQSLADTSYLFGYHVDAARRLIVHSNLFPWYQAFRMNLKVKMRPRWTAFGAESVLLGHGKLFSDGARVSLQDIHDAQTRKGHSRISEARLKEDVILMVFSATKRYTVDPAKVETFVDSLLLLESLGVEVHTLTMPISDEAEARLPGIPTMAAFRAELERVLPARLAEAGIPYLPERRPSMYGLDSSAMLDWHHGGEVFSSYVVEELVRSAPPGSRLATVDLEYLRALRHQESTTALELAP